VADSYAESITEKPPRLAVFVCERTKQMSLEEKLTIVVTVVTAVIIYIILNRAGLV